MSRLLFAAARGARIRWAEDTRYERPCNLQAAQRADNLYRIHPDDAHLQYGPISSALREQAEDPPPHVYALQYRLQFYVSDSPPPGQQFWHGDTLHRSLFLLILAEALADEGL